MDNLSVEAHRELEAVVKLHLEEMHDEAYAIAEKHGLNDFVFDEIVIREVRNLICENI